VNAFQLEPLIESHRIERGVISVVKVASKLENCCLDDHVRHERAGPVRMRDFRIVAAGGDTGDHLRVRNEQW